MPEFRYDEDHFIELAAQAQSHEELDLVEKLWTEAEEAMRLAALKNLRDNSVAMLDVIGRIIGHIEHLTRTVGFSASPAIGDMRAEMGRLHAELHDAGRSDPADEPGAPDPGSDAAIIDGATTPVLAPGSVLSDQIPINSSSYADLADEYVRFFNGAGIRPSHLPKVRKMAQTAFDNRARYQSIGTPLGIPWWFIAGLHQMESTYNFEAHLHNGDPLGARTSRVPGGKPDTGAPPFTFEESATDALRLKGFDQETDWSLPRALFRFERYNGFGYRSRRVPSPYLWGFSTIYRRGKFIADHVFDANAVTQQCGVGALLRQLSNDGRIKLVSNQFADLETDDPLETGDNINRDAAAVAGHTFEAFWRDNLSDVRHFDWDEFLFKGASNATHRNNTDPPAELYNSVTPLVRVLDEIRNRIGGRISLNSVYRSPAYNGSINGASSSRHMAFDAADFRVIDSGHGNSGDWADVALGLRRDGFFEGGIGIYNSFVHVDTRGHRATWDERGT
ncbi:D-Ala-D-Ala carboxypeptidase family metallohydrolase [uncultured Roseobacter sp.]|uniref:D-Ala-D-Ala carboxypeptidase family metallohydrolase n=1 Tax=uncultured Roseobacter sp. TaxID=114847 RepID=UPI0026059FBE|nr:D-Ala-D-Ala carboxypeptidase family metallohydrolase [uncultured Roseobacter sp.]